MIVLNNVYGVVFNELEKKFYYVFNGKISVGDYVIVNTDRGEQLVKVVDIITKDDISEYESIERIANESEYNAYLENLKDSQKALKKCKEYAKELELDMNVVSSHFNLDRSQLLFNFTADGRVDFRELAKRLAAIYHTRIELRQIGARDKAKSIDGYGVCGRRLCCAGFLNHIDSISMNMAKNQNIALNPSKINGCCGRLLCCLTYEDEQYSCCRVGMPTVGKKVTLEQGEGKVIAVDILNRKYKVLIGNEVKEIELDNNESSKE